MLLLQPVNAPEEKSIFEGRPAALIAVKALKVLKLKCSGFGSLEGFKHIFLVAGAGRHISLVTSAVSATPVQPQCNPSATPVQHQCNPSATPVQPQCDTSATPVQPQCNPSATPVQPQLEGLVLMHVPPEGTELSAFQLFRQVLNGFQLPATKVTTIDWVPATNECVSATNECIPVINECVPANNVTISECVRQLGRRVQAQYPNVPFGYVMDQGQYMACAERAKSLQKWMDSRLTQEMTASEMKEGFSLSPKPRHQKERQDGHAQSQLPDSVSTPVRPGGMIAAAAPKSASAAAPVSASEDQFQKEITQPMATLATSFSQTRLTTPNAEDGDGPELFASVGQMQMQVMPETAQTEGGDGFELSTSSEGQMQVTNEAALEEGGDGPELSTSVEGQMQMQLMTEAAQTEDGDGPQLSTSSEGQMQVTNEAALEEGGDGPELSTSVEGQMQMQLMTEAAQTEDGDGPQLSTSSEGQMQVTNEAALEEGGDGPELSTSSEGLMRMMLIPEAAQTEDGDGRELPTGEGHANLMDEVALEEDGVGPELSTSSEGQMQLLNESPHAEDGDGPGLFASEGQMQVQLMTETAQAEDGVGPELSTRSEGQMQMQLTKSQGSCMAPASQSPVDSLSMHEGYQAASPVTHLRGSQVLHAPNARSPPPSSSSQPETCLTSAEHTASHATQNFNLLAASVGDHVEINLPVLASSFQ
eukprot:gene2813-12568_t